MTAIPFTKMHGTGNDFVVIDNRKAGLKITPHWAVTLSDRRFGIGCDQFIVMEASDKADVFMRIFNADGSEIGACGNASRCIGWRVMQEKNAQLISIETQAGVLECRSYHDMSVTVDMGEPKWEWDQIPLSEKRNTEHLGIAEGRLMDPVALNIGNPHMVFFVNELEHVRLAEWGPKLEHHPLFPKRANVSAAQVVAKDHVKLRVWERGTGETLACGTAACATVVAGVRRGMLERESTVSLPGGDLTINWNKDSNRILMTGPVAVVFAGTFDLGLVL